jgi:CHAT domain-containing protein/tetratricopeptide (TPR) repeat protein
MNASTPSKMDILQEFMSLQSRAMPLLFDSNAKKSTGDLTAAAESYQQLIDTLQRQLDVAELNNGIFPETPFQLHPIVEPLMNAQLTLADVLEGMGDFKPAETIRDAAVSLAEKYMPRVGTAERYRQRAQSLLAQSRYPEALVALHGALDEFERQGDLLQVASVTRNIAEVLEWLGDFSRARKEAQRASSMMDDILEGREPSAGDIAEALRHGQWRDAEQNAKLLQVWVDLEQIVARLYRRLGDFEQAEAHFRKVLPKTPEDVRPAMDFQLAVIAIERQQHEAGLRELERIGPLFVGLMRQKLGVVLSWKAEALLVLQRPREALGSALESVRELEDFRDTDSLWKAQWRLARVRAALGDAPGALEAFVQAAQTVDNLRKAPLGYRLDSTYMADKLPLFEQAIGLACDLGAAEVGCTLIELVKSRALTAALSLPKSDAPSWGNELAKQIDVLSQQIDALEYAIYCQRDVDVSERRRNELLEGRARLLEQLRFSDPRWRSLTAAPAFSVPQVLEALAEGRQSALTLFCRPGEFVAVLLKEGACRIAAQPLSPRTQAALHSYRDNLSSPKPRAEDFDPAWLPALSAECLIPPALLDDALSAESVVVIPHGGLHLLPWAGLGYKGRRLFDYCPVAVLPNLSCVMTLQTPPGPPPRVALIGAPTYQPGSGIAPLPWAEAELNAIADLYEARAGVVGVPMIRSLATEQGFRQLASAELATGAVLHVACHGTFETGEPMNSGLLLADGRLDTADLSRMRLPFNEVVLSACSTGFRPTEVQDVPLSGDDVLGLPAALLEAGARALLVSIPPARDDATLALMTLYHEHRAAGQSPLRSLRSAQLAMMATALYPAYLWIGFTLYGCR